MKKWIAALALGTLWSSVVFADHGEFSDVGASHENNVAIYALYEQGVLNGYEDGTFKPEQEVSRAEAVKILLLGLDVEVNEDSIAAAAFSDVADTDWFFAQVGTAMGLGIVKGYDDNTFRPSDLVNRAELVKMAVETAGLGLEEGTDVWYSIYEDYALEWNVAPLQSDGDWHAGDAMTRGEVAELVYRMQVVAETGASYDESDNWLSMDFEDVNLTMKVPFGWSASSGEVSAVWLLDEDTGISVFEPGDNGASLLMQHYTSGTAPDSGEVISLEDGSFVHVEATVGSGDYGEILQGYVTAMIASAEYLPTEPEPSYEDILEEIRAGVQVDGQGEILLALLDDWELIETDSIGVGTGPVDYYYSPSVDYTVKYERSFDVILDLSEGSTSAF